MACNDHSIRINNYRLAEPELPQTGGHGIHRLVVDAGIVIIGLDRIDATKLDTEGIRHKESPEKKKRRMQATVYQKVAVSRDISCRSGREGTNSHVDAQQKGLKCWFPLCSPIALIVSDIPSGEDVQRFTCSSPDGVIAVRGAPLVN